MQLGSVNTSEIASPPPYQLLDAQLLELDELGAARLQEELAGTVVLHARGTAASLQRHELRGLDLLVVLAAALVARVRGDRHLRLDLGRARHDALHDNDLANVLGAYLAQLDRSSEALGARYQLNLTAAAVASDSASASAVAPSDSASASARPMQLASPDSSTPHATY